MPPEPKWLLLHWEECLDRWAEREQPSQELRTLVTQWLMTRMENPHEGVKRLPDFPSLWFGKITGSDHGRWAAVSCTYEIDYAERVVHVRAIATLNKPY